MAWNDDKTVVGAYTTSSEQNDMIAVIEDNEAHVTSTGASHTYIDQSVVSGASPTFISTKLKNGNNSTSYSKDQLTFAWNSGTSYKHAIKTRHDSQDNFGNAIDFFLWDAGVDAAGDVGTFHALTLEQTGSLLYTDLDVAGDITLSGTVDGVDIAGSINQAVLTTSSPTFNSLTLTSAVTGDITADQFISTNNGNGTNYRVGDDAWIGDVNSANTVGIRGVQDATAGVLVFGSAEDTNIYRGGANVLKTDDTFNCPSIVINSSATVTSITAGSGDNDKIVTKGYVDDQIISAGSGDVLGPASSTDNAIARFSGTTGKVIQESGVTIDDNKNVDFIRTRIEGGAYTLDNETFHTTDESDVFLYKGKPIIFQPKKKLNPYNPLEGSNETYGQKYVMARMLSDRIKVKGKINGTIILWALLGIGALYFITQMI